MVFVAMAVATVFVANVCGAPNQLHAGECNWVKQVRTRREMFNDHPPLLELCTATSTTEDSWRTLNIEFKTTPKQQPETFEICCASPRETIYLES